MRVRHLQSILTAHKSDSLRGVARLAFRKLIFRKVRLDRYEARAGANIPSNPGPEGRIEMLDPSEYQHSNDRNPYLTASDLSRFRAGNATCIAVVLRDEIVASTWMVRDSIYATELQKRIYLPPNEHYLCRGYVTPGHRGKALWRHMISAYAATVPADHTLWGLVYAWNTPSARSLTGLGWRHTATYWTVHVLGIRLSGERPTS